MTKPILNALRTAELDVTVLTDPLVVKLYRDQIAGQINHQRSRQPNPKEILDLSDWIADIIIETTVQGASLLEVHVIDPGWVSLRRDDNGVAFFDVDDQGYLWPPIYVNFPVGDSDAMWRLCQLRPSTDLTSANVIITFEDDSAAAMREFQGPVMSRPNETRAEFIRRLVNEVRVAAPISSPGVDPSGNTLSGNPVIGQPDRKIRFVALLSSGSPTAFTQSDLTSDQQTLPPVSSRRQNAPPARKNPTKKPSSPGAPPILQRSPVNGRQLSIADGFSPLGADPNVASGPVYVPPFPTSPPPVGGGTTRFLPPGG